MTTQRLLFRVLPSLLVVVGTLFFAGAKLHAKPTATAPKPATVAQPLYQGEIGLDIYPNPAQHYITLKASSSGRLFFELICLQGQYPGQRLQYIYQKNYVAGTPYTVILNSYIQDGTWRIAGTVGDVIYSKDFIVRR